MKKLFFLFGICFWFQSLGAQTPEIYSRVRIDLRGHTIGDLAALGIETDHGHYEPGRSLTTVLAATEFQVVQQAGFVTEILIPDLKKWFLEQKDDMPAASRGNGCDDDAKSGIGDWKTPANYTAGSMGGYPTYGEMLAVLDDMRAKFPNLISVRAPISDTILTHEGRPIWWVKISDNPDMEEPEPEMLYDALHHAREPNSLSQLLYYMWYLLENYTQDPSIHHLLDHTELYFVPCLNPDGYLYNEQTDPQGGGLWRKNRRDNGDGTFGVDLNRNYGYQWGVNDQGSSPSTGAQTYRGPAPFSEPETRMVRDFCLQHDFKFALNYHAHGNLLIYPWAYSDQVADPAFQRLAALFIRENQYSAGTSIETVGYRVNGSSDDWMFGGSDIYSYTPEVGPGEYSFWPPASAIIGLNQANMWQNLAPAFCLLRFGVLEERPASSGIDLSKPRISFRLQRLGFEDGPLTVSLLPLTPNIIGVGAPIAFNLDQFTVVDSAFTLAFATGVQPGDTAIFVLQLDNGVFTQRDTLRRVLLGPGMPLFTEAGNGPLPAWWVSDGTWGTTTSTFVSSPSSIAESPGSDYAPESFNSLFMTAPIAIPADAKTARLRFWARWAIEKTYDYVAVYASDPTVGQQLLCGRYTRPGSTFQIENEPVFDGFQDEWVEESMDLSAFIGKSVTLQFDLVSDGFQEYEGFNFDDLRIEYTAQDYVGTVSVAQDQFALRQNQPNPAGDFTRISWENTGVLPGTAALRVFDVLGKLVLTQTIDWNNQTEILLDTRTLAPGSYLYYLQTEGWQSPPRKMTIVRR